MSLLLNLDYRLYGYITKDYPERFWIVYGELDNK